jgi:hypothetical protein
MASSPTLPARFVALDIRTTAVMIGAVDARQNVAFTPRQMALGALENDRLRARAGLCDLSRAAALLAEAEADLEQRASEQPWRAHNGAAARHPRHAAARRDHPAG